MNEVEESLPPAVRENQTSSFPWAWYKAIQDIVNQDPPSQIPTPPVKILPWLYLSPFMCVKNKALELEELGITHVLSTNRMPPQILETLYWELRSHGIDHHYVAADDQLSYDMLAHWEECRNFLKECSDGENGQSGGEKRALVHCAAGMNRSGTIVAAAMMHFGDLDLLEAVRFLKASRGYALSNTSFVRQLVLFAEREGRLGAKPVGYSDMPVHADGA